ncbi:DNA sulfur modification protein DndD [Hydrogenophaga sp. IBVHS2]|uniref:DNA sulfur modification protein DndD n=1 Tax=Hydrogenophaga sp. IBVHS2 TaxID=1985170 RepID=UPI000A2EBE30|nr:DNA sulfur modification protein DndD [Hydrogenophaga sp. IBVHS2]OSZ63313.1 DNA sulfur modification protein DndD [Hydrogenophaga sp. IBVHS2]
MAKVTFKRIGIQNLGPYLERQYLDLRVLSNKPIILVRALNGSGKTTLLNCLQIALYGAKAIGTGRAAEYEQLIRSLHRDDAEGPAQIVLDLQVEANGERENITISRQWQLGTKLQERTIVTRDENEDPQLAQDWTEYLDGILPAELLQLFLFDGEKIEALANPKTLPEMLRRATEAFLGIGGIDALQKDLVAVERRALLQAKEASGDYEQARTELKVLEGQQNAAQAAVDVLRGSLPTAEQEAEKARTTYERASQQAQRSGLGAYERAAEIRAAEQAAREEVNVAAQSVREALADPLAPLALAGSLWNSYKTEWAKQQDTHANKQLLSEIQRRDQRVLKKLRDELPSSSLDALRAALSSDTKRYTAAAQRQVFLVPAPEPESLEAAIRISSDRHEKARAALADAKRKLGEMERSLASIPAKDQLAEVLADLKKKAEEQARADERLAFVKKQLEEQLSLLEHTSVRANAARARMSKDFQGNAHSTKAIGAAMRSRAVLAAFKERLLASKAKWLSEKITEEFQALMRKQRLVTAVRVDPDSYEVTIVGGHGKELPMERLSAGERQLLAIAVLSALIRERKGQFPVVVDTPLARLDRTHREALIRRFFAKVSHQVLVLSTDEEVEGTVFDAMARYTSKAYQIEFSDQTRSSHVGPFQELSKV